MKGEYLTWREAYQFAISEAKFGYRGEQPTQDEFVKTFEEFWNEITTENTITVWAIDPAGTQRMVKQKAMAEWEENWGDM